VVAHVYHGHQVIVVADTRLAAAGGGTEADGRVFADAVLVAHHQRRGLAPILQILGLHAQNRPRPDYVAAAQASARIDRHARPQATPRADDHVALDDAVRPDDDVIGDVRAGVHHRGGMNAAALLLHRSKSPPRKHELGFGHGLVAHRRSGGYFA